jgi:hypothetical protein
MLHRRIKNNAEMEYESLEMTNSPDNDDVSNGKKDDHVVSISHDADEDNWRKTSGWPLGGFLLLVIMALLLLSEGDCGSDKEPVFMGINVSLLINISLWAWIAWLFAWLIHCFTGDPFLKRTRGITFAYFFTLLSFVAVSIMIANIGRARTFGVVDGCIENLEPNTRVPIQCNYPNDNPASAVDSGAQKAPAAAAGGSNPGVTHVSTSPIDERVALYRATHNYHHLLNIGGHLYRIDIAGPAPTAQDGKRRSGPELCPVYAIRGGVPVPIYFILLALIGSAISLAKNVPTIQRRSDMAYVGTLEEPKLTPSVTRELLIFQVLQFVSAPFLAVTAYHTIKPESAASTVALGFLTGFASETILTSIRTMLKGKETLGGTDTRPLTGNIYGFIKDKKDSKKVLDGALVRIQGLSPERSVKTDMRGAFKFESVPISPQPYSILATWEDAGAHNLKGTASVALKEPTDCNVGNILMEDVAR